MTTGFSKTFIESAIEAFSNLLAPITAMSYAVNVDGAALNDVVAVPFVANTSASADFTYSTGYSGEHNLVSAKDITLSRIMYQKFDMTDADMTRLSDKVIAGLGSQAGARLANDVISASIAAVVSNTNFPTSASAVANELTSSTSFVALNTQCDNAKWPQTRNLIMGTEAFGYALSNPSFNTAYAYGSSTPIQNGVFQNLYGFTPYKVSCALPNESKGLVLNPNAILVGLAPHRPAQTAESRGVKFEYVVDPKSNLAISMRSWYDPDKASTRFVLECLWGATVGDTTALFQLK